jgi:hypothetical protein
LVSVEIVALLLHDKNLLARPHDGEQFARGKFVEGGPLKRSGRGTD